MEYSELVEEARTYSTKYDTQVVVFYHLNKNFYDYTKKSMFEHRSICEPLVRMLLIMPNGTIVQ